MIAVKLSRAGFEYDLHSLTKAFFPSQDVSVSAQEKEYQDPVSLRIEIERDDETAVIRLSEPVGQEPAGRQAAALCTGDVSSTAFSVADMGRQELKNVLKRKLYDLLAAYTGKTLPWGTLTGVRPTKLALTKLREGWEEPRIRSFLADTYYVSPQKALLGTDIAKRELALFRRLDPANGYSLYIGIPFCPSTCLYCSFTSYPLQVWQERVDDYLRALGRELDFVSEQMQDRHPDTVYIGGGTPTTLSAGQLDWLLGKIRGAFGTKPLEFTVEAGRPDSITREKLAVLREHGITRISINPQTMKQETLDLIGRRHTVRQTIESFRLAREMGFDNINMDLIMGLPQETLYDVTQTLEAVCALAPDSITVHSLALKRAARLSTKKEDYAGLTIRNTQEHLDAAAQACADIGMEPYYLYRQKNMAGNFENVGYAVPGREGLYNIFIMEEVQTIVACGAGTITKRVYPDGKIERCENVKDVSQYIERIEEMIERKRVLLKD